MQQIAQVFKIFSCEHVMIYLYSIHKIQYSSTSSLLKA